MLRELSITGLGVIEAASVEFGPGLNALTGETGAGKTMVTSGLGLLLGGRGDAALVRVASSKAVVEGRFDDLGALQERLDDLGAELDDAELLVARHLTDQGRSRSWLGGVQVPAGTVGELAGDLVTIHGQSEQLRLGTTERQREVLDRACGAQHLQALDDYREVFALRRTIRAEVDDLRRTSLERAREADLLRFGVDEVTSVNPRPGEDADLVAEVSKLQSMDDLRRLAARVSTALSGDPDAVSDDPGAVGLVGVARKAAGQLAELDQAAAGLSSRLTELGLAVNDLAADVASYQADLDHDPLRLESLVSRQADLARLTRKYGTSIDEVLAWAEQASTRLLDLDGGEDRIVALESRLQALDTELQQRAAGLSVTRESAAARLQTAVAAELAALALPHARLLFRLDRLAELGPHGAETVSLLFSANPGSVPGPLAKVASGGELSRVRLALEVTLAADDPGHTFVFDEVDAGVGGAVALEIGRRLRRLAEHSQVIVVTHLAQVAAFATTHVVVSKSSDGEVTTSGLHTVSDADREQELARMMGGLDSIDSALAHARDLLVEAGRRSVQASNTRPRS